MSENKIAAIFDMDGTLADTIESIRSAINMTMEHYGFPRHSYEEVRLAIGNGARKLIYRLVPESVASDDARVSEILDYYNARYAETFTEADHCYPGVGEAVRELAARGVKIAILSNKPDVFVRGIAKLLFEDGIVAIAQGQTELPIKPDPAAPLDIARRLGVEPGNCFFVGDSDVDILTAKNAGMTSVGCSWGYRGRAALEAAGADFVVDDAEELLSVIG